MKKQFALKVPNTTWPKLGDTVEIKADPNGRAWGVCEDESGNVSTVVQPGPAVADAVAVQHGDKGLVTSGFIAISAQKKFTLGMFTLDT